MGAERHAGLATRAADGPCHHHRRRRLSDDTRIDGSGNVSVAGYVVNDALQGSTLIGSADIYAARYSPAGDLLWATQTGAVGDQVAFSAAIAPDGGLYVSGRTTGTLPNSTGTGRGFLLKYGPDGTLR